jgi:hypothetical protein
VERAAGRMRTPQRGGIEAVETERARSRPRASNCARRCYAGARRTRTGRRWLLACLTTCLLMVAMRDIDPGGGLLAVWNFQTSQGEESTTWTEALTAAMSIEYL